jgi:hypothetical protein
VSAAVIGLRRDDRGAWSAFERRFLHFLVAPLWWRHWEVGGLVSSDAWAG